MVDVLHQLLKKIVMHLIGWVGLLLKANMPNTYRKPKNGSSKATYSQLSGIEKLDKRFYQVSDFTGLKRFTKFSALKQWTGVEQKAIVRQIMPVLAPLSRDFKQSDVLDFCWALVDFILIAQYCSHDDTALGYLDQALMRINVYKEAFQSCWRSKENLRGQFDFPKFHVMSHYFDHVWKFGTTDGYNMAHYKANHKFMLKVFYDKTNKRENFQEQLLWHNWRQIKTLAMKEIMTSIFGSKQITKKDIEATITKPIDELLDLRLFGSMEQTNWGRGSHSKPRCWCMAIDLANVIRMLELILTLTMFVQKQRQAAKGQLPRLRNNLHCHEPDLT